LNLIACIALYLIAFYSGLGLGGGGGGRPGGLLLGLEGRQPSLISLRIGFGGTGGF